LELRDGVIEAGKPAQGGASAFGAAAGEVELERMEVRGDMLLTGAVTVRLVGCTVTGAVRVREGAKVEVRGGSVRGGVDVRGTTTRSPTVTLIDAEARVTNDESMPGTVVRR
jgi:hypothetical protein